MGEESLAIVNDASFWNGPSKNRLDRQRMLGLVDFDTPQPLLQFAVGLVVRILPLQTRNQNL